MTLEKIRLKLEEALNEARSRPVARNPNYFNADERTDEVVELIEKMIRAIVREELGRELE